MFLKEVLDYDEEAEESVEGDSVTLPIFMRHPHKIYQALNMTPPPYISYPMGTSTIATSSEIINTNSTISVPSLEDDSFGVFYALVISLFCLAFVITILFGWRNFRVFRDMVDK